MRVSASSSFAAFLFTVIIFSTADSFTHHGRKLGGMGAAVQDACPLRNMDPILLRGRNLQETEETIITNGVIKLGVNSAGQLNVPGGKRVFEEKYVGLRYIYPDGSGESEAASFGCECEGWGVFADGDIAWANRRFEAPTVDASSVSFTTTTDSAISSLRTVDGSLQVTHDFHPSAVTPNLYEVTVTLENLTGETLSDIRYRRVIDFDVYPKAYNECITIQPDPSIVDNLIGATNFGFAPLDDLTKPLTSDGSGKKNAPMADFGPRDQGAAFDFVFDPLDAGESHTFNLYYGAASNQADAEEVTASILAEVYAFAKPSTRDGDCTDTPNTYIMAFTGVGGDPVFEPPTQNPSSTPSSAPTVEPSSSPLPSLTPSSNPSAAPSVSPSSVPSSTPSSNPTSTPTPMPSSSPSTNPSSSPSSAPSSAPSSNPTSMPSSFPSTEPSPVPSAIPSSKPSLRPSAVPSSKPSSVPSSMPSNMPSSQPSNGVCIQRGYANACGFTTHDQRTEGYTAICAMKTKKGSIQYKNQCKKNSDLEGLAPGDSLGKSGHWVLQDCGCCDEGVMTEGGELKKADQPYCKAPICTPEDDAWEPCDESS